MQIFKEFTFDSAHVLPNVPDGHKCKNLHGHTYHLKVCIEGKLDAHLGWVIDFGDIKKILKPIIELLDHNYLNDIPGLENPTCEIICKWLWDQIKPQLNGLVKLELRETPTSGCVYEG
jgi:6-pyruvoyltetrahydropterin/6-carboxytetrahydropterin synthase